MNTSISTFILTYNEEKHIARSVKNAFKFSKEVFLIDSFSTDKTVEIAASLGAKVFQNKWENNHSKQVNWGLKNLPFQTEWIFRLDADEYLTDELIAEIHQKLPNIDQGISGIVFERKMYFLNVLMEKGMLQMNILRLFRNGHGVCEDRWMDEHIVLSQGKSMVFENYFIDHNLNPLGWWIQKHNNYSIKEAIELIDLELNLFHKKDDALKLSEDAEQKRAKKKKYAKMPLFWRSFTYFTIRYFFKLGFTQGKEGFIWHFLQGWWYRALVDAKVYEIRKNCGQDKQKIRAFLKENYNISLN
ncbi:glycosyltransferase family 2 protein [Polaribacter sp. M15]